jgi:hypothetical protein
MAAAKPHLLLQIKPGLWQFDTRASVSGDTVVPDALLASIPPGQRAQHLAELRRMLSQPSRERECISKAAFERRLFTLGNGCNQTIASNTATRIEVLTKCHAASGDFMEDSTSRLVASTPRSATTAMHAVSKSAGRTMIVNSVQSGRWISSDCGGVHGIEELP